MTRKKSLIFSASILLLFYFVFLDELSDTFIFKFSAPAYSSLTSLSEEWLTYLLLGTQIVCSPLQAGFSDYRLGGLYLRRKSLIFSLAITLLSITLFNLSFLFSKFLLIFAVILKGALGNTLPIAWAGIADITPSKDIRFALALSIFALAIGSWGSLLISSAIAPAIYSIFVICLAVIALCLAIYPFRDVKDLPFSEPPQPSSLISIFTKEMTSISYLIKTNVTRISLISFIFSEISFYQVLFRIEVFSGYICFIYVPLAIGIGYTIGTIFLKFIYLKDKYTCLCGMTISFISIVLLLFMFYFSIYSGELFTILFAAYSLGYAIFTPSLFSLITPRQHPHLQGKIYGLIESSDSLASLITLIFIFNRPNITCDSVLFFSAISIFVSFLFFGYVFYRSESTH